MPKSEMPLCYRTDGRKATVRVRVPPPAVPADVNKLPSSHSPLSSKRKSHSLDPASNHSSLRSVSVLSIFQSEPEQDKKPCHESLKTTSSLARRATYKPLPSHPCRLDTKSQPPQEQDIKKNALPNHVKVKNNNNSLIEKKRREFFNYRKQLMHQQNTYIDMFAQLRDLEDRSGVPPGTDSAGEVRLLSITEWPVHDLLLLAQNTPAHSHAQIKGILGTVQIRAKILRQLNSQLSGIPEEAMALATQLMQRRFELLEYIRSVFDNDSVTYEGKKIEWQVKNAELDEESEKIRKLVMTTVKSFEVKIIHSLEIAKIPWIDRDNMVKKIESVQKELSIYKNESIKTAAANKPKEPAKTTTATNTEYAKTANATTATEHKLHASLKVAEELAKERAARSTLKETAAVAETKAATARARCAELERQLHETKVELLSAQRRLDNLKQPQHYRASNNDNHSKKMEKMTKTGEVTKEALSRQRDALELRVRHLQEQATANAQDAEIREHQLYSRVESLRSKLEEQEMKRESLEVQMQESEKRLKELQEQFNALQERSRELIKLQQQKCIEYLPRKVQCSGEELEIWQDLQATKETLRRVKEELELSRADKDCLLNSLAEITVVHEGSENKMAEELLSREKKITKMQNNIEELTENKRKMEETIACYENQLSALRMEVNVLRSLKSYESYVQDLPQEQLEREVFTLCMQVEKLTRERAAWKTEAATRALLLERHERCAELFAQVTRARRDLAAQLDGNGGQSVFEVPSIQEVADTLSNAFLASADIWSAVRAERLRVVGLENTILAQKQALDRESAARLQHERKRAQLERELIRAWAGTGSGSVKCVRSENKEVEIRDTLY